MKNIIFAALLAFASMAGAQTAGSYSSVYAPPISFSFNIKTLLDTGRLQVKNQVREGIKQDLESSMSEILVEDKPVDSVKLASTAR